MKTSNDEPRRILILKLSSIGDVVMAMPVATALKRSFPGAWITWAAQFPAAQLLSGHPGIDEVVTVRRPRGGGIPAALFYLREWIRLAPLLRGGHFDVAVDLQGLLKAALLGRLAGAPRRLGFADERRELNRRINNVAVRASAVHAVDRYLEMAKVLGAEPYPVEFGLPISPQAEASVDELLDGEGAGEQPLVGLLPFASDAHKCWPGGRFAQLAQRLSRKEIRCVIVGGPPDAAASDAITETAGAGTISCAGRTDLPQLAALLRRCSLVIGNDTGPLHVAAAVGTPVLGLYGATDPEKVGPYGWVDRVLLHRQPCWPCGRKPTCTDSPCMMAISVEEVVARAREMPGVDF